jgi:MFS family permease
MRLPSNDTVRRLTANRSLTAVVLANGISSVGDWLYLTVLPVLVFRETGDAALVGLVGAARLVPWLLLSVPAGALVDRVPVRQLLLVTEASRAGLMLVMAGLSIVGAPLVFVMAAALGAVVAGTFAMPAHGRLVPELASEGEGLGPANVVSAALDNLACVLGPAIAGLLIVTGSLEVCFLVNGLSFLSVVAVLARLPRPTSSAAISAPRSNIVDASSRGSGTDLWAIAQKASPRIVLDAAVSFAAGALWILPVLVTVKALQAEEGVIGLLSVAGGLGGIVGAAVAGRFVDRRPARGMAIGLGALVLGVAAVGGSPVLVVAVLAFLLASGALVMVDTLNVTELQRTTSPGSLGRTLGLLHTSAAACVMLGSFVPGIAIEALGVVPACLIVAVVVGVLGAASLVLPRLARPTSKVALPATS